MDDSTYKNASDYLKQGRGDLSTILTKVKLLGDLSQKIIAYLDPTLAQYCQVANVVNNTLVVMAANGSVATQLRFQTRDILGKFSQDPALKHILSIQYKVRPSVTLPTSLSPTCSTSPTAPMALLSQETSKLVYEVAQSITDPKLKEAMLKIASHVKKEETN